MSHQPCRFGARCTKRSCKFRHPNAIEQEDVFRVAETEQNYRVSRSRLGPRFGEQRGRSSSRGREQRRSRSGTQRCRSLSKTAEQDHEEDSEDSGGHGSGDLDAVLSFLEKWESNPKYGKVLSNLETDREGLCSYGTSCRRRSTCKFRHPDSGVTIPDVGRNVAVSAGSAQQETNNQESDETEDDSSDDGSIESYLTFVGLSQDSVQGPDVDLTDPMDDNFRCSLGICPNGYNCTDLLCPYCDPYRRLMCKSGAKCWNRLCPNVHPEGWSVCDKGVSCCDYGCTGVHPEGRAPKCRRGMRCGNPDCEDLHPDEWSDDLDGRVTYKSSEEREEDRKKAGLPMLAYREEFVRRLREEGVLVVTAETGSGKTTQLCQYAAEAFDRLVVCTQPRVIAAISIAQRVATEFDGASVGQSVGYQVGGRLVRGRKIMIVTDAAMIRMAQNDAKLDRVGVLIIDEAHERSLNTDVVAGIAKWVRQQRPQDFRVVVSSATMDPKPFLEFFFDGSEHPPPLNVPGRVFPVTLESRHITDDADEIGRLLAEEVVCTLKQQPRGHCLVFLPGAREVEQAIVKFKKASPTPHWIPLPLHGSLPPEQQKLVMSFDDQGGKLRMVVFCTNVAETSLTVPGVRIVIDTGLAKEARYDPRRRMNILELVYVSRSSADQRKGRAGRTEDGHCVRLYRPQKLERESIQPEILRSSLDQVVLELCGLNYDPMTFDLIDRPKDEDLRGAVDLLLRFGCITADCRVTERGRLFNKLPFDPRLSHVVLEACESGHGQLAIEIAAIISAPGSIVFFGGKSDDAKRHVPKDLEHFSSDLVHLRSLFRGWLDAGNSVDVTSDRTATCTKCRRKLTARDLQKDGGCRPCRVEHSLASGLNNKMLDIARGTIATVTEVLKDRTGRLPSVTVDEAIGRCLATAFPEQVAEFLLPSNPDVGVHLMETGFKAMLSFSSTLMMPRPDACFLIPMSITRLPSGRLIVDQAHHVDLDWLPSDLQPNVRQASLAMTRCFQRPNVNSRFRTHCFKHFQKLLDEGDPQARFVVPLYEADRFTVVVYAPRADADAVEDICRKEVEQLMKQELEYETVVGACNGTVELTLTAGMVVCKVTKVAKASRVRVTNPPVRSDKELLEWVCKKSGAKRADIKWYKFLPGTGMEGRTRVAIVDFRDEKVAQKMQQMCAGIAAPESADEYPILLKTALKNFEGLLGRHGVKPDRVVPLRAAEDGCLLKISNIPEKLSPAQLKALLDRGGRFCPKPSRIRNTRVVNGTYYTALAYPDTKSCSDAMAWLKTSPRLNESFQIMIPCKHGGTRPKVVQPTMAVEQAKARPAEYLAVYKDESKAKRLYDLRNSLPDLYIDGNCSIKVVHSKLYDLEQHVKAIAGGHGVNFRIVQRQGQDAKVIFLNGSPTQCFRASRALRTLIAPIRHRFLDREKQILAKELHGSDGFAVLAQSLNLHVEHVMQEERCTGIVVYGERFQQGQFMAKLADYYVNFLKRYSLVNLPSSAGCLFRQGCIGDARLKKLNEQNAATSTCEMTFLYRSNAIEIVVSAETKGDPETIIQQCQADIEEILGDCHQPSVAFTNCVYCTQRPGTPFSICGHKYCKDCLEQVITQQTSSFPFHSLSPEEAQKLKKSLDEAVCCPKCSTAVSIRDITSSLRQSILEDLCTASALLYISTTSSDLAICPAQTCRALVPKSQEYGPCPLCSTPVCSGCGTVGDPEHLNKTCDKYRALLQQTYTISGLASEAEKFARDHWRTCCSNKPDITKVDVNPGLYKGCMALQRYCKGIERFGVQNFVRSTLFAWHGTAETSIPAICNEGFDPRRRSGQACGPGEYFGIDAQTSMGYSKGVNRLIVAQIVKVTSLFHQHTNFCYVVNNPGDWSAAYNLPVLVISFGPQSSIPWMDCPKLALPKPFYEPSLLSNEEVDAGEPSSFPKKWFLPVRWHWSADGGRYEPYPEEVSIQIEERYVAFKWGSASEVFDLKPVTRYNDHNTEVYTINFAAMVQINKRTQFRRSIKRLGVDSTIGTGECPTWKYYDRFVHWTPWKMPASVEDAYQRYVKGTGSGSVTIATIEGQFEVDFIKGSRRNLSSHQTEQIWREVVGRPPGQRFVADVHQSVYQSQTSSAPSFQRSVNAFPASSFSQQTSFRPRSPPSPPLSSSPKHSTGSVKYQQFKQKTQNSCTLL